MRAVAGPAGVAPVRRITCRPPEAAFSAWQLAICEAHCGSKAVIAASTTTPLTRIAAGFGHAPAGVRKATIAIIRKLGGSVREACAPPREHRVLAIQTPTCRIH